MQTINSKDRRAIRKWLLETSLPERSVNYSSLPTLGRVAVEHLIGMAREQKTLSNLLKLIEENGAPENWADIFHKHRSDRRLELVTMMRLRKLSQSILSRCESSRLIVVKGPSFADLVYPRPEFRAFTDIDILVAPDALEAVKEALDQEGFEHRPKDPAAPDHPEQQFVYREHPNLVVETHTDLVHLSRLRQTISLTYDDIADAPMAPSSHLLVALVHGFVANQYRQVGNIVDVVLASQKITAPEDKARLHAFAKRGSNRFWLFSGLMTAGSIYDDDSCLDLGRELGGNRWSRMLTKMIKYQLVPMQISTHSLQSLTRKIIRHTLSRQARAYAVTNNADDT